MPTRTFIARKKKSLLYFKASENRLTLLVGTNAVSDFKLKPELIYHSETPLDLKNYA